MPPTTERAILHFTDAANIPRIVAAGGLHSANSMSDSSSEFVECASVGIKTARQTKPVPVHPFGFVGDYVPFYYAARSPMMSAISNGKVPNYTTTRELVYLVSSVGRVDAAGLAWVCTEGNARTGITRFFNTWPEFDSKIDWKIMKDRWWRDTEEDGDRKRRRAAEFLVRDFFPLELVSGLVVHNSSILGRIREALPPGMEFAIEPDFYI